MGHVLHSNKKQWQPMVTAFQSVPVVKISRDSETKKCPDFSLEPGNVKPLEQRREERDLDNGHREHSPGPRDLTLETWEK